jgi:hypothetical protein
MSVVINLLNVASKVNNLTKAQLYGIEAYAQSIGFNVSKNENMSEWVFFSNEYGEYPMIHVYYSASFYVFNECHRNYARLRVAIPELSIGMQAFGEFMIYAKQANEIAQMIIDAGGRYNESSTDIDKAY